VTQVNDLPEASVLVLTTDLPYFPGKMGVDYFNLRHVAQQHRVGVVGPCYESFPKDGVANLEAFLDGAYFWPRPAVPVTAMLPEEPRAQLSSWVARLPGRLRLRAFRHLLGIKNQPSDAIEKLAILSNCAPQLLRALTDRNWHSIVLIQTNIEPWLDYLPPMGGKVVYFHDVRADYFIRTIASPHRVAVEPSEIRAIQQQEQRVTERADVVGFVSELDHQRANRLFRMRAVGGVAAISVDTSYYTPAPADWVRDPRHVVLFTGHLAHPPNVDAVLYFLKEIWPSVLRRLPDAVFQAVGMVPAPVLVAAMAEAPQCELHANVPDIRPYFWNASTYVVPMRYGGGVRQKIFEAWSMGVPVVCTTMAAEGTGAEHGVQCFLEDVPETFAERVAALSGGVEFVPVVSAAKSFVESTNSVSAAAPGFQRLIEMAIAVKRNKPFKLLYDLRWMELGHAGGIEQATYELVSAIAQIDRRNGYRVMAPRSACCEWEFPQGFDVQLHYSDHIECELEARRSLLVNGLAESVGMAPILNTAMRNLAQYRKLDFDLVHSVAGYTHPDLIGFPNILTINDLQHIHYPEFFTPQQYEERERLYRESADRANHIICISEFTRQDVHRQYGVPLEKMSTVWIVPSRNVWQPIDEGRRDAILERMGLSSPFLFFPAHCWPHKNHARLVDAFSRVLGRLPPELKLMLTGRAFPDDHPAAAMIRERGLESRVLHLGYRSPLEIQALFQGCMSLVFPSLFEGYGMPVAEAIIAGKPVLCSNVTSLPEIAGDAALTFDPMDVEAIGEALVEISTRPDLRASLSDAAIRRRNLFAARRSAIQTMSVYNRVYQELYGMSP
jgi:glycosyltransferase involved in cell wall biosynthesis